MTSASQKFSEESYFESKRFLAIRPILENWIKVQREYITAFNGRDYPWHYRERTQIGFLAVAAWYSDAVGLEEWKIEKGERYGRNDLYIYLPNIKLHLYIEAKHRASRAIGTADQQMDYIERALFHATEDVAKLDCSPRQTLGVLFLSRNYPADRQKGMAADLTQWLERVYTRIPHCSIAWLTHDRKALGPRPGTFTACSVLLARRAKKRGDSQ